MYLILKYILFKLDSEVAHNLTLWVLKKFGRKKQAPISNPINLFGLSFPNRVGMAAGLDKNGECIDALFGLGFGFVEVGTVTPKPQAGNPKPRLFRLIQAKSIINRMGFNNKGVDYLVKKIKERTVPGVLGVNIGKNKNTPNEKAYEDYVYCLKRVYNYADYITINISSPNTPGLRDLQSNEALDLLLQKIMKIRQELAEHNQKQVPILIKISPDYPCEYLEGFANIILKHNVDGVIATNTSIDRSALNSVPYATEQGGLSGKAIFELSTKLLSELSHIINNRIPIIGVGGVDSVDAAQNKIKAGASLVQLYTGLIYGGPKLIHEIVKKI